MRNRHLAAGLNRWQQRAYRRIDNRDKLQRAVARMTQQCLSRSLAGWEETTTRRILNREKVQK